MLEIIPLSSLLKPLVHLSIEYELIIGAVYECVRV